ncbi:MAG: hypothetical protein HKN28_17785 [Alphaproteobacteria bacterium]|nr:hypothetical protein [Alphaproteobacteria bacterium]
MARRVLITPITGGNTMKKSTKGDVQDAQDVITGGGSIDQIREILFGGMQRDLAHQLDLIEKQFEREKLDRIKLIENTKKSLEQKVQKLSENLGAKLDQLKTDLKDSQKENRSALNDVSKELNDNISSSHEELSQNLSEQAEDLRSAIETMRTELERALENLDDDKTGRADLGDYLLEIAMRLKGDSTLNAITSSVTEVRNANSNDQS